MKKTVPQSRKEALMLAIDKRCPGCGHDISAPRRIRGVCETCGKPYQSGLSCGRQTAHGWVTEPLHIILPAVAFSSKKKPGSE